MEGWKNQLYFGDNLEVLRKHIPVDSIDLIYLDPPFNSNATYNMLFKEPSGEQSAAQIAAFDDTWKWGPQAEEAFDEAVMYGPPTWPNCSRPCIRCWAAPICWPTWA